MSKATLQQIKEAAKDCATRTQFKNEHPLYYRRAYRQGWLNEVCEHMSDARVKWTKEKLLEAAKEFSTRSEFNKGHPQAYHAARYRGWLDEVCQHMGRQDNNALYVLRIAGTEIYKVGVTSQHLGLNRIENLRTKCKEPMDLLQYSTFPGDVRYFEKQLLSRGKRVTVPGIKSTEFRLMTKEDLSKTLRDITDLLTEVHSGA